MPDGARLILVVGPSGAGKDSVMRGARAALADRRDVVFPRRVITRPPDASGGEDHEPCAPDVFRQRVAAGDFALHWQANGLDYGVPEAIDRDLAAGKAVVVNVSRAIVADTEVRYPGLCVCVVTASAAVRAGRLQQRGRESVADIASRLERATAFTVAARHVREIDNDGPLEASVALLVETILSCLAAAQPPAVSA
jgi:phosphonate metabolism protein PhnN/1,5-bisphosphokinase (PRPP-forming)